MEYRVIDEQSQDQCILFLSKLCTACAGGLEVWKEAMDDLMAVCMDLMEFTEQLLFVLRQSKSNRVEGEPDHPKDAAMSSL